MRTSRTIALLVLVVGLAAFLASSKGRKKARKYPSTGYTMLTTQTFYPEDGGEPQLQYSAVRYVTANGEWKWVSTHYHPDGGTQQNTLTSSAEGSYRLNRNDKELDFLGTRSTNPQPDWHDSGFLRSLPQYYRDDSHLGYEVIVHRRENQLTGGYYETYYAPAIGKIPVRTIDYRPGEGKYVTEAFKIELGEPDEELVKYPALSVNYDAMLLRIKSEEEAGNKELANRLRNQLESDKQKH